MLSRFRKYAKPMMIGFGVLLMFSFVIAPPINDFMRNSAINSGGGNETVVQWEGGSLNEIDLRREYEMHAMTVRFLNELLRDAHQEHFVSLQSGEFREDSPIQFDPNLGQFERTDLRLLGQKVVFEIPPLVSNEAQLVQKLLFAQEAEKLGIRVTDDTVTTYLGHIASNTLAADRVDAIRKESSREQLTRSMLFAQLRKELLAEKYRKLVFDWPTTAPTPGQAREYFDRVNRRIKIAVVPIEVERFADRVSDPSDAESKQFYDDHSERFADPLDPEPGFKERRKISWAYVSADLAPFIARKLDDSRAAITDQDIEDHYARANRQQQQQSA